MQNKTGSAGYFSELSRLNFPIHWLFCAFAARGFEPMHLIALMHWVERQQRGDSCRFLAHWQRLWWLWRAPELTASFSPLSGLRAGDKTGMEEEEVLIEILSLKSFGRREAGGPGSTASGTLDLGDPQLLPASLPCWADVLWLGCLPCDQRSEPSKSPETQARLRTVSCVVVGTAHHFSVAIYFLICKSHLRINVRFNCKKISYK